MHLGNSEIISIIDSISKDKGIPRDDLMHGVEAAIEEVGKKKYGSQISIKAVLNKKSGEISLYRVLQVVESVSDRQHQILLTDAQRRDPDVKLQDDFFDLLPPINLGRSEAAIARNAIVLAVKRSERDKEYSDFIERMGEIIFGVVKRIEFGHIIIDLGRSEAILKRDQQLPTDKFKLGDRIKSYIYEVRREDHGAQIFLSRTHDHMLAKLLEMQIPEVYDGLVEVKAVVRDPGFRAKVAVYAVDSSVDAISCCVGAKGSRIKSIMEDLNGEKIDIINWDKDLSRYVINALGLSRITKVLFEGSRIEVIVSEDQLSSAIGRGGQNVKLASRLTKCGIDVMTEEKEAKRRLDEFYSVSKTLIEELDLDETLGQFLVAKGFVGIEQIASTPREKLMEIEGFDEEIATELLARAQSASQKKKNQITESIKSLGVEDDLKELLDFADLETILRLAQHGIKNLEDLAMTTPEDLKKLLMNRFLSNQDVMKFIKEAKIRTSEGLK
jgi:N utilization substance protein A